MKTRFAFVVWGLLAAGRVSADIVWDQVPNQSNGYISDTDAIYFDQQHYWERMADDFQFNEPAELTQVVFFGFFYNSYFAPDNETIRLRFLGARLSDGLPDESLVLYENSVQNPLRQATGLQIIGGPNPPEYRYAIDLTSPVSMAAQTKYWLEVVQLDDPDSDFAWESAFASANDRTAGNNANYPNWAYTSLRTSIAFQLVTPEPNTVSLMLGFLLYRRRRVRRGAGPGDGS